MYDDLMLSQNSHQPLWNLDKQLSCAKQYVLLLTHEDVDSAIIMVCVVIPYSVDEANRLGP